MFDTQGSDRIIAFASERQLDALSLFPCVPVLTPDRTKITYKKLIQRFIQSTSFVLNSKKVIMDFEQGAISELSEEFPDIVVKGCHFRFTQAIWRRIQELVLAKSYKEDKVVSIWFEKFKS